MQKIIKKGKNQTIISNCTLKLKYKTKEKQLQSAQTTITKLKE